jgi:hypothetical protein
MLIFGRCIRDGRITRGRYLNDTENDFTMRKQWRCYLKRFYNLFYFRRSFAPGRFKSREIGPVMLSVAKNLSPHPAQILRDAQHDRAL